MSDEQKQQLHEYLGSAREAVLWKAEGLSEYDVRTRVSRSPGQ